MASPTEVTTGLQESQIPKKYRWLILRWSTERKLSAREIARRLATEKNFKTSHSSIIRLVRNLAEAEFVERTHENLTATLAADELLFEEMVGEALLHDELAGQNAERGDAKASNSHHRSADRALRMASMLDRRCARLNQALAMKDLVRRKRTPSRPDPSASAQAQASDDPDVGDEAESDVLPGSAQLSQIVNELKNVTAQHEAFLRERARAASPTRPAPPAADVPLPTAASSPVSSAPTVTSATVVTGSAPPTSTTSSEGTVSPPASKPAATTGQPEAVLTSSMLHGAAGRRIAAGMIWLLIGLSPLAGRSLDSLVGRGWTASRGIFTTPDEAPLADDGATTSDLAGMAATVVARQARAGPSTPIAFHGSGSIG